MKECYLIAFRIEEVVEDVNNASNYEKDGFYLVHNICGQYLVQVMGTNTNNPIVTQMAINDYKYIDIEENEAIQAEKINQAIEITKRECELDLEKMKLENDNPKKNGCGEWISGKTLKEIISVIVNKESEVNK